MNVSSLQTKDMNRKSAHRRRTCCFDRAPDRMAATWTVRAFGGGSETGAFWAIITATVRALRERSGIVALIAHRWSTARSGVGRTAVAAPRAGLLAGCQSRSSRIAAWFYLCANPTVSSRASSSDGGAWPTTGAGKITSRLIFLGHRAALHPGSSCPPPPHPRMRDASAGICSRARAAVRGDLPSAAHRNTSTFPRREAAPGCATCRQISLRAHLALLAFFSRVFPHVDVSCSHFLWSEFGVGKYWRCSAAVTFTARAER